jgi:hypothetical protein
MEKIDFKKQFKQLYSASATKISIVEVPAMNYLSIDGKAIQTTHRSFQMQLKRFILSRIP